MDENRMDTQMLISMLITAWMAVASCAARIKLTRWLDESINPTGERWYLVVEAIVTGLAWPLPASTWVARGLRRH
jgi:hypothetical protein